MTTAALTRAMRAAHLDEEALVAILHGVTHEERAASSGVGPDLSLLDAGEGGPAETPTAEADAGEIARAHVAAHHYLATHSVTVAEAARRIGRDRTTVERRVADGSMVAIRIDVGKRLPTWQFMGSGVLPHLREVLDALPAAITPIGLASFFETGLDSLDGATPREWLGAGRDVSAVVAAATHRHAG